MQLRYLLCYFVSLTIFSTTFGQAGRLHPELLEAFDGVASVEAMVLFQQQTRLYPTDTDALVHKADKGRYVYEQISKTARNSQAEAKAYLDAAGIAYRSIGIANLISLELTEAQARTLAGLANVDVIIPNPWVQQDLGFREREAAAARQAVEWGVQQIGAPELWDQGFTGQGVTVGGQDTGYDYLHPTLIDKYRGLAGGDTLHDYNWHDAIHSINPLNSNDDNPCGLDVPYPCDDNNHGTHTMGTMVGDDGQGNQIGVAPGASWIACRNMERGWGSPASYLECFEWFLAPTRVDGSDPDPGQAPHVIANSWSCPEIEGCLPETFALFDVAINNLRAAGVVVVTSAGNDGSDCMTISKPPAVFPGAYSIGATNEQDNIAGFSSRGPATYNGETYLQPQVVAPGVNVRSATRNGGFASFSGTSMAGPHTAGAVAVLISALPELAGNVEGIEQILRESAVPLLSDQDCGDFPGSAVPNAVYGYGRIDLVNAYALGQELVSNRELLIRTEAFTLAPNPAGDVLTVSSLNAAAFTATGYVITDLTGRELGRYAGNDSPNFQLDLSGMPGGVYLLRIESEQGVSVLKFVHR